jgi:Homeodomain-like domain
VHPAETRAAALALHQIGMTPAWIGRELGVARRTVAHWLQHSARAGRLERPRPLPSEPYAYLLGLYLGDGHISEAARRQPILMISCDPAYPGIIAAAQAAMTAVVPDDIRGILCKHLDLLSIGWTRPNAHEIAVDRRAEVAKLDAFVGPKR